VWDSVRTLHFRERTASDLRVTGLCSRLCLTGDSSRRVAACTANAVSEQDRLGGFKYPSGRSLRHRKLASGFQRDLRFRPARVGLRQDVVLHEATRRVTAVSLASTGVWWPDEALWSQLLAYQSSTRPTGAGHSASNCGRGRWFVGTHRRHLKRGVTHESRGQHRVEVRNTRWADVRGHRVEAHVSFRCVTRRESVNRSVVRRLILYQKHTIPRGRSLFRLPLALRCRHDAKTADGDKTCRCSFRSLFVTTAAGQPSNLSTTDTAVQPRTVERPSDELETVARREPERTEFLQCSLVRVNRAPEAERNRSSPNRGPPQGERSDKVVDGPTDVFLSDRLRLFSDISVLLLQTQIVGMRTVRVPHPRGSSAGGETRHDSRLLRSRDATAGGHVSRVGRRIARHAERCVRSE
jgi:hypothetical protein